MFDVTKLNKYIPTVEKPIYKVSINKKLMWTGIVLVVYYLMSSQLFGRVYGVAEGNVGNVEHSNCRLLSYAESLSHAGSDPVSKHFKKHASFERGIHPKIQ